MIVEMLVGTVCVLVGVPALIASVRAVRWALDEVEEAAAREPAVESARKADVSPDDRALAAASDNAMAEASKLLATRAAARPVFCVDCRFYGHKYPAIRSYPQCEATMPASLPPKLNRNNDCHLYQARRHA